MKLPTTLPKLHYLRALQTKKKKKRQHGDPGPGFNPYFLWSLIAAAMAFWALKAKVSGSPYRTILEFARLVREKSKPEGKKGDKWLQWAVCG